MYVSYLYCFCPIEYTGIMHTNIPFCKELVIIMYVALLYINCATYAKYKSSSVFCVLCVLIH